MRTQVVTTTNAENEENKEMPVNVNEGLERHELYFSLA